VVQITIQIDNEVICRITAPMLCFSGHVASPQFPTSGIIAHATGTVFELWGCGVQSACHLRSSFHHPFYQSPLLGNFRRLFYKQASSGCLGLSHSRDTPFVETISLLTLTTRGTSFCQGPALLTGGLALLMSRSQVKPTW